MFAKDYVSQRRKARQEKQYDLSEALMPLIDKVVLIVFWFAWAYPFIFRAPHKQNRPSITLTGPTRAGLLLESLAILIAFACQLFPGDPPGIARMLAATVFGILSAVLSWSAVAHLGRQFRVNAGLYEDHELVRTGPYAIVRHPIYSSLLAILLSTLCVLSPWQWALVSLALFVAGTEIRVHAEDGLLFSRFGPEFTAYQKKVRAYVPFVR
jgi:protein-S-isoprenylcysteine O-methyltransferase Ste14